MAFTYTEDLSIDRDFVRFHTGDVVEITSLLSDLLISNLIDATGSKEQAVIAAIQYKITRLSSDPNFKADWLEVDNTTVLASLKNLLEVKRTEFGLAPRIVASITHVYRADSAQTSAPDFSDGRP